MTMNNSVHTTVSLEVLDVDLSVTSAKAALSSDKTLKVTDVTLKAGASASSLAKTDAYNGENCISAKAAANKLGSSILFGESVPKFVDIIIVVLLLLLIAAGIAVPFARSYQKGKKARAALEAVLADNKSGKKN